MNNKVKICLLIDFLWLIIRSKWLKQCLYFNSYLKPIYSFTNLFLKYYKNKIQFKLNIFKMMNVYVENKKSSSNNNNTASIEKLSLLSNPSDNFLVISELNDPLQSEYLEPIKKK